MTADPLAEVLREAYLADDWEPMQHTWVVMARAAREFIATETRNGMPKIPTPDYRPIDLATLYWTLDETDLGPMVTLWEPLFKVRWWRFGINRRYRRLRTEYWFPKYDPTPEDCARHILRQAKRDAQARIEARQRYDAYREPQPLDLQEEE